MQPRIYTYKITFEEIPHWYWGVHKEKKYGETYLGSPVTHKWMWDFYTPKIQILGFFPYTEEGWKQANEVERRIILPDLHNELCLNENCAGVMSWEAIRKAGSISIRRKIEVNPDYQSEVGRLGAERIKELGVGIYSPGVSQRGGLIVGPIPVWNDGERQIKSWAHPGDGWARGNIPHENSLAALSSGRHPWWNKDGVEKRSPVCPGPGWQSGRTKKPVTQKFNYESSAKSGRKSMAQRYTDPDHLELGQRASPVLVRMQKKRGYPHGPENRVRVL